MISTIKKSFFILLASAFIVGLPNPHRQLAAQELQGIAAVVNDDVISMYDLQARMTFIIATLNLENTPESRKEAFPQVLRALIDERLQLQAAKKKGIAIAQSDVDGAITGMAEGNQMTLEEFNNLLKEKGIDPTTLKNQIKSGLAWREFVQRTIRPFIEIGDEEIQDALTLIEENKGKPEYLMAEIFLAVDGADEDKDIHRTALNIIENLQSGRPFQQLASQFSNSATAASGGDLGWVQPGQLDETVDEILESMQPGQVRGPIRGLTGYHIILLRDKRISGTQGKETVTLQQILLPLTGQIENESETLKVKAADLISGLEGCDAMAALKDDDENPLAFNLGELSVSDLPGNIREAVEGIDIGKPTTPITTDDGVMILMACARTQPKSTIPSREQISDAIERNRLDIMSQKKMRDLRGAAHIDIRTQIP